MTGLWPSTDCRRLPWASILASCFVSTRPSTRTPRLPAVSAEPYVLLLKAPTEPSARLGSLRFPPLIKMWAQREGWRSSGFQLAGEDAVKPDSTGKFQWPEDSQVPVSAHSRKPRGKRVLAETLGPGRWCRLYSARPAITSPLPVLLAQRGTASAGHGAGPTHCHPVRSHPVPDYFGRTS